MNFESYKAARKAEGKATLLQLGDALKAVNIRYLVGFYDGSGDSGQIEKVQYFAAKATAALNYARSSGDIPDELPTPTLPLTTYELEEALWKLTPAGFENAAGGFGAVIFDAETGKINVNFSYWIEATEEADYEV